MCCSLLFFSSFGFWTCVLLLFCRFQFSLLVSFYVAAGFHLSMQHVTVLSFSSGVLLHFLLAFGEFGGCLALYFLSFWL